MVRTRKQARRICNSLIEEKFPGYVLMLDKLAPKYYLSVWGKDRSRVEIAFSRKIVDAVLYPQYTEYEIVKNNL